jgi:hypothetical protein
MNFQIAATAGGVVFGLSFIAGLFGGVPFFDVVIRALVWGVVGFGGSLGIETVLRSLLPDLFVPRTEEPEPAERNVDITLEEERPAGFVEEEGDEPVRRAPAAAEPVESHGTSEAAGAAAPAGDEEMPEIGSFLDAFKPQAPNQGEVETEAEGGAPAPDYGDYRPTGGASEVTIDGEAQDPAILAKAIQTVLKRDAQGS